MERARAIRLGLYRFMSDGRAYTKTALLQYVHGVVTPAPKVHEIEWELNVMIRFTCVQKDEKGRYELV